MMNTQQQQTEGDMIRLNHIPLVEYRPGVWLRDVPAAEATEEASPMTRKDYILIANALAKAGIEVTSQEQAAIFEGIVDQLAEALALDNSRFDRAKFNQAATGGGILT